MMGSGSSLPVTVTTPAPVATASGSPVTANPGAGDHTGSADNTRLNTRDRSGTLTPIDQGNSKAEIAITASIRRGVMSDHALSFTAKNVKVITVGSRVTLRGPVKSDAERTEIENLARQTAGVTDVDDQLEVKN
jgi:osmotically-inducible protein OsmY